MLRLFHQLVLASMRATTGLQADLDFLFHQNHHPQQQNHQQQLTHHQHDFITSTQSTLVNQSVLERSLLATTRTTMQPLQLQMELMQPIAPRQLHSVPTAAFAAAALSAALPAPHQRSITSPGPLTSAGATTSTTTGDTRDLLLTNSNSSSNFSSPGTVELQIKTRRRYSHESFPEKLHRLIQEAVDGGKDHIVAWIPDGHGFEIHSLKAFENEIIPAYFRHQKLASFRRQLSMYGFRRDCAKQEARRYVHEMFHRDYPERCKEVKRLTDFQLVLKHPGSGT